MATMSKADIVKRWRKLKLPRLYWKKANWRWYRTFDSDDVAITENMRFKSFQAIVEFVEYHEHFLKKGEDGKS